jgi:prepilin peptidase dependent protein C
MNTCDGLSLTEVLVSLVIVTSASLALLQQQWHVSRYTHQINHRNEAMRQLDNASEQLVAQQLLIIDSSYQLATRSIKRITELQLRWENDSADGHLKRLLVRS